MTPIPLSEDRLLADLAEVNGIGALDDGGVERLAWTRPEAAARAWLPERCSELGLRVDHHEAGNVWAWPPERPCVVLGSHLDTCRTA